MDDFGRRTCISGFRIGVSQEPPGDLLPGRRPPHGLPDRRAALMVARVVAIGAVGARPLTMPTTAPAPLVLGFALVAHEVNRSAPA